jgi:hypothetical protein
MSLSALKPKTEQAKESKNLEKRVIIKYVYVYVYTYDFNESFSELFLRLLSVQKINFEKTFGAWNLNEKESKEIWGDITNRPGRKWKKTDIGELEL